MMILRTFSLECGGQIGRRVLPTASQLLWLVQKVQTMSFKRNFLIIKITCQLLSVVDMCKKALQKCLWGENGTSWKSSSGGEGAWRGSLEVDAPSVNRADWHWVCHESGWFWILFFNDESGWFGIIFFKHLMYVLHMDVFWTRYFYFWFVNAVHFMLWF